MRRLICGAVVSLLALNVYAGETEISIYNQNMALIKKGQTLQLNKGVNEVVFDEVAQELKPESVFIYGDGIHVLEQNYDYAGINYETLLNANVGKKVKTVRVNPADGKNVFQQAKLLAVNGIKPILQFDYGIEADFNGQVLFDEIPLNLNSMPVLMAKVEVDENKKADLGLAYLTSGFSWNANYVVMVNDNEMLSILGRAAISNNSGSGYENVKVNLIAGNVNTVNQTGRPMFKTVARGSLMMANAADSFDEAAVIDEPVSLDSYYIYKIPETVTLKSGQLKQVSFLTAPKVKYHKEGNIVSSLYFGENKMSFKDVHPLVYYHFNNDVDDGLGIPLPKGKLSFYKNDNQGVLQFIGENMIADTAKGQKVSLQLGQFFDVYAKGGITEVQKSELSHYQKKGRQCPTISFKYMYDVEFTIENKSEETVHMVLKQNMPANTKVVEETIKGVWGDGQVYEWYFDVNAGETKDLKGKVEKIAEQERCDEIILGN